MSLDDSVLGVEEFLDESTIVMVMDLKDLNYQLMQYKGTNWNKGISVSLSQWK